MTGKLLWSSDTCFEAGRLLGLEQGQFPEFLSKEGNLGSPLLKTSFIFELLRLFLLCRLSVLSA